MRVHWGGGGCQSGQLVIEEAGGRWRQDYLMIGLDPNLLPTTTTSKRRRSSWPRLNFYLHSQGQLQIDVINAWVKLFQRMKKSMMTTYLLKLNQSLL